MKVKIEINIEIDPKKDSKDIQELIEVLKTLQSAGKLTSNNIKYHYKKHSNRRYQ